MIRIDQIIALTALGVSIAALAQNEIHRWIDRRDKRREEDDQTSED